MHIVSEFFQHLHSLRELISWGGLFVLVVIIFAETGLLVGFFLPGDSLLVTAGLFAATGDLQLAWILPSLTAAAIAGNGVGYWIGRKAGPHLFSRPDSHLFKRENLVKTHRFYEKHGAKTIVLSRFIPILRTFAPVVAGVADMPFGQFMTYNLWGGIGWVCSMILLGYFLGNSVPHIEQHIDKVILVVIVVSLLPVAIHAYKERAHAGKARMGEET
jgi:membrane-associated protein